MTPTQLWEKFTPLALRAAEKKARVFPELRDDLRQAALMGLWEAASRTRRPTTFASFAKLWVRGRVSQEVWCNQFWGKAAGQHRARGGGTLPERVGMLDPPECPPPSVFEDHDLLDYLIEQVEPERLRTLLRRHYLEGLSLVTVAHQFGYAVSSDERGKGCSPVYRLRAEALRQLAVVVERLKKEWGET